MEYIEFDCSPVNEDCVSIDSKVDYMPAMKAEAQKMIALLEEKFPNVPGYFKIKSQMHDFGSYLEIRYYFPDDQDGWDSSNFVESNYPQTWDDTEPCLFNSHEVEA